MGFSLGACNTLGELGGVTAGGCSRVTVAGIGKVAFAASGESSSAMENAATAGRLGASGPEGPVDWAADPADQQQTTATSANPDKARQYVVVAIADRAFCTNYQYGRLGVFRRSRRAVARNNAAD